MFEKTDRSLNDFGRFLLLNQYLIYTNIIYNCMKKILSLVFVMLVFAFSNQAAERYLVKKGKTNFRIVLSDLPCAIEETAAKELKMYLDESTKINWEITSEKDIPEDVPQILIGNSSRAKKFFPEVFQNQIPYDGIEIHLKGNMLLLAGHEQRGVIYAVNTFLETVLGIRWWTSTEQFVPIHKTLQLDSLDISYAPKLIYREAFYKDAFDPVFAMRMKCNGHFGKTTPEYGDHHHFSYWCHSFFELISPEKYFKDHPEWFSEINGVRQHENAQLCLTNDEMRKELTKNVIEALRKNPEAKFVSVSQMDWYGPCMCEKCREIVEKEEAQSGPLVHFINKVAEDVEKEFPNVFVETLAYNYTRKPPMHVKPRKNVVIRLCTMGCAFGQPLISEQNKSFYNDMEGWGKIAHQLFIWDYVTNFSSHILPHPNLHVIAPNIRFFFDKGTIGLFEQGDANCELGDFVRMRNWIISKLMWDPTLDERELRKEFLTGYYGRKATPFLLEYFDILSNRAEASKQYIHCYQEDTGNWLDYESLKKITQLFNKAIIATEKKYGRDSDFAYRLHRDRMPLEHVWLKGYPKYKRFAEMKNEKLQGPVSQLEADKTFFNFFDEYQLTQYREYQPGSFDTFKEGLLFHAFGKKTLLPEELSNIDSNYLMDIQDYDFQLFSLRWIPTNHFDSGVIEDVNASNGRAVKLPNSSYSRATVRLPFVAIEPLLKGADVNTKYKVIIYARCETTEEDGLAMVCEIGNGNKRNINISEISGSEYRKIEFDSIHLDQSMFLGFIPSMNEKILNFIDRVIIIKEK